MSSMGDAASKVLRESHHGVTSPELDSSQALSLGAPYF